jgi:hypothetical protein
VSDRLVFASQAQKDAKKLKGSPLAARAKELLQVIESNAGFDIASALQAKR